MLRALSVFAALRLAGIAAVISVNHLAGRPPVRSLSRSWDSKWYLHIAEFGYGHLSREAASGLTQTDWAFFPLYPMLIRAVTHALPLTVEQAALLIAWSAALAAAYGIYACAHRVYGSAVATVLVALWGMLPHSVVLTLAYTEALFAALAAWALYAVLTDRWLTAGVLAALAGLSRPTGIAVAAAVVVAAAEKVVRRRGPVSARPWIGALLAPAGWAGYVLWVGAQNGDLWHGYTRVQSTWQTRFDFGVQTLGFLKKLLLHGGRVGYAMALVIVAAGLLLFLLLCVDRAPLVFLAYAAAMVALAVLVSGPFGSKPRFLLPAFPLLIPLARALEQTWRTRRTQAIVVAGALAVVSISYGAYVTVLGRQPL
ncbi:hypothetical protein [Streptomyces sp. cg35]|uniref:hypothetical protein n=1 Tax=Streptomyces sp. cg35 TaxID=3421650 RepID=UPI003D179283